MKIEWRNIIPLEDLGQVKRIQREAFTGTHARNHKEQSALRTQASQILFTYSFHELNQSLYWLHQVCNTDSEIKLKFLCYLPTSESKLFPGDYSRYANRRIPDSAVSNKQILLAHQGQNLDSRFSWIRCTHCYATAPTALCLSCVQTPTAYPSSHMQKETQHLWAQVLAWTLIRPPSIIHWSIHWSVWPGGLTSLGSSLPFS